MSRIRTPLLLLAAIVVAAGISACGGSSGAQETIDEATLEGVHSGNVHFRAELDLKGEEGGHLAVQLSGPFQGEGGAETTELDLTAAVKGTVDGKSVDFHAGLTLLHGKAYVQFEGTEYKVDPVTYGFVKSTVGESEEVSACQEVVSKIPLSDFVEDPVEEGDVTVLGTSATRVGGDVNAEAAIDALIEMTEDALCAQQLKAAPGELPSTVELEKARDEAQGSIGTAHVSLYVGEDHIVRRIVVQVPNVELPKESGGKGGPEGIGLESDFILTGVNEEQNISAPRRSKPLSSLFIKLGVNPIELLGLLEGQAGLGSGGLNGLLEGIGGLGSAQ